MPGPTATLLLHCPDRPGIVATLAGFVFRNGGNIVHSDQHTDASAGVFFLRLEWELAGFRVSPARIAARVAALTSSWDATFRVRLSDTRQRMAIWVGRQEHCLFDLLLRHRAGELSADLPLVVSNHEDLRQAVAPFGIPFHVVPVTPETRDQAESAQLDLVRRHGIDLIVLAKYMQVLSPGFLAVAPAIINIHHSFLPAFPGANPYQRAHERGVKLVGATAHYVTPDLDAGPIIEQDVIRASHRDSVQDLVREGRDAERRVLARAVRLHLEDRVLVYQNKTVVFD